MFPVDERELVPPPGLLVVGIGHERKILRVLEAEDVISLVVALRLLHVGGRKAAHLLRSEGHLVLVVADVALELLPRLLELWMISFRRARFAAGNATPVSSKPSTEILPELAVHGRAAPGPPTRVGTAFRSAADRY
jgi:hypothetical protein